MKFDKKYYTALKTKEFRAAVVHELGHCTRKAGFYDISIVISLVSMVLGIFSIIISVLLIFLVPIFYLITRWLAIEREFICDKIVKENQDYYEIQDLISAIKKAECKYDNSLIEKCFRILKFLFPHPSNDERARRLLIKPKPHIVPRYVIYGFFLLGLASALAFRSIIVFQQLRPGWIRPVWYMGITGYLLFFYYRYRISRKRKQAVSDYNLIEKVEGGAELTPEEREVLTYLLSSIKVSMEDRNYRLIFILSILAIAADLALKYL